MFTLHNTNSGNPVKVLLGIAWPGTAMNTQVSTGVVFTVSPRPGVSHIYALQIYGVWGEWREYTIIGVYVYSSRTSISEQC